jgi:hypothetical protein
MQKITGNTGKKMTNRREFLQLGLTASLCIPLPAQVFAFTANAAAQSVPALYKVIHDTRYLHSTELAHSLRDRWIRQSRQSALAEIPLQAVTGNVTALWYGELQPLWLKQQVLQQQGQQPALALAGTTGSDVLFCLERLAWDAGLRVLLREEHVQEAGAQPQEALVSWVIAAPTRAA